MHERIVTMVKPRGRLGQPFYLTNDRDIFSQMTLEMPLINLRLSQGYGHDSKLGVAYTCRGCASNGNFHCRQRPMLKNRVVRGE